MLMKKSRRSRLTLEILIDGLSNKIGNAAVFAFGYAFEF